MGLSSLRPLDGESAEKLADIYGISREEQDAFAARSYQKAAAAQKPVIDWTSFVLTADQTNFFARYWFGKFPWEDPQGYWARSPLSLAGNVKTPTLVVPPPMSTTAQPISASSSTSADSPAA